MLINSKKLVSDQVTALSLIDANNEYLKYNLINCCRIGIVDEYFPESQEVRVRIANKMTTGINEDGSQIMQDYAPITAKVYFIGSNDIGLTYPLEKGSEGLILFNDRELESWYINGEVNPLSYFRAHDITDAIFLCGLHSQPHFDLVKYITNCLNIYYKNTSINIKDGTINLNTSNLQINNKSGATGSFVSKDDKTITVTNGIITNIG